MKFGIEYRVSMGFPDGSVGKESACSAGECLQWTQVQSLRWEGPLEKEMVTHSSILAWKIPWTEEPGGLQSHGVTKSWTPLKQPSTRHGSMLLFQLKKNTFFPSEAFILWKTSVWSCFLMWSDIKWGQICFLSFWWLYLGRSS